MPELRTVVCNARGPRSLADGRMVPVNGTAKDVDVTDPHNQTLIDAGDLAVVEPKPRASRKAADNQEASK